MHVSCTAGSSPWEIGWSLSCDGVVVASHGGSSFNQVVSFPRTNATGNGSSPCTLTLTDSGDDGWAGATWAGFGQSNLSLANGSSTEITFLASVPTEPPHFQLAVPLNASSGVGGAFEAGWGACGASYELSGAVRVALPRPSADGTGMQLTLLLRDGDDAAAVDAHLHRAGLRLRSLRSDAANRAVLWPPPSPATTCRDAHLNRRAWRSRLRH